MNVKLLNEHHLECLSLKGCCRGSSEATLVKMSRCWKSHVMAHVCPMPKDGDITAVSNYSPISLLSNINKDLERIVFKHLHNHFLENYILTNLQSGFSPGYSTVNQLLFLYYAFCKALNADKEVRVIFCNISKAFDRGWHTGLIHKLRAWFTN